jgi:CysZ protein
VSSNSAVDWLSKKIGLEAWLQKERNEWLSFLFVMAGIALRLMLFYFYFSLFKYFYLIIGSPVFSYLSEKTSSIIEGKEFSFSFSQLLMDMRRGILIALRNAGWQTFYVVALVFLSIIPVFGWVAPLIGLFIECYYYGFSMVDYSLERNRFTASASMNFISHHKGLAIGNGIVFYLMHGLILIGWVLAPAYAVIAATLSLYKVRGVDTRVQIIEQ